MFTINGKYESNRSIDNNDAGANVVGEIKCSKGTNMKSVQI